MNEKRAVLPSDIREAFHSAFGEFWHWRSGIEPVVAINRGPWPISWLCGLVLLYDNERMPDRPYQDLRALPDESRRDLKGKLSADQTYHTAAICFRELIRDQRIELERRAGGWSG
jgi:hypothetical protein